MVFSRMVVFFSNDGFLLAQKKIRKEKMKMAIFLFKTWRGDEMKDIPTKDLNGFLALVSRRGENPYPLGPFCTFSLERYD